MTSLLWNTPVELAPDQRRRVEVQVERLAALVVSRWEAEIASFGFMQGKVGVAFALYELAALEVPQTEEHAEMALVAAVNQFNSGGATPGLHTGVAGLGWLVDAWLGEEDICGPIDDSLRESVLQMAEREPLISLRRGLAGIGLYAARRAPRVESARALLQAVSNVLSRVAVRTDQGVTWNTPKGYLETRDGISLFPQLETMHTFREWGSAHGVAPLTLLLAECAHHRVPAAVPTRDVLKWVWGSTTPQANRFGWLWGDGELKPMNVSSWCTGDHGVALPCWLAATEAGLTDEAAKWLEFGRGLAQRTVDGERPGLSGRINLCCGLCGVLQGYSTWAALTGDALFADAARVCLSRVLDEVTATDVNATSVDLQFGLAGYAATLAGLLSGKAPTWAGPLALMRPDTNRST